MNGSFFSHRILWCVSLALVSGETNFAQEATFQDKARAFFGMDGGKRRAMRESLVRSPDGTWCVETPQGLVPHSSNSEFVAAQELFGREQYSLAAKAFRKLGERFVGSALHEDCLFFEAESLYKDGRLPTACDTFHKLLKEFPNSRHLNHAVQRTYDIANEWLEDSRRVAQGQPSQIPWYNRGVNFFDRRRPMLDTPGRAIEAIEHIQQFDPNGPLTASATMMAGAEKFTSGDYIRSAGYYEQVVISAPKSEHAPKAAVLSAQSYLRSYQGPSYDAEDLQKAQQMTEQALRRSAQLPPEQRQKLELDLKKIYDMRAERQYDDGMMHLRLRKWRGAEFCFRETVKKFPDTKWAEFAKVELEKLQPKLASLPAQQSLKYGEDNSLRLPKIDWPKWQMPSLRPNNAGGNVEPLPASGDEPPREIRALPKQNTGDAIALPPARK